MSFKFLLLFFFYVLLNVPNFLLYQNNIISQETMSLIGMILLPVAVILWILIAYLLEQKKKHRPKVRRGAKVDYCKALTIYPTFTSIRLSLINTGNEIIEDASCTIGKYTKGFTIDRYGINCIANLGTEFEAGKSYPVTIKFYSAGKTSKIKILIEAKKYVTI